MPWSEVFLDSAPRDEYNIPLIASTEWWTRLANVLQAALITSGTEECFADDIKAFAEKFKVCVSSSSTEWITETQIRAERPSNCRILSLSRRSARPTIRGLANPCKERKRVHASSQIVVPGQTGGRNVVVSYVYVCGRVNSYNHLYIISIALKKKKKKKKHFLSICTCKDP